MGLLYKKYKYIKGLIFIHILNLKRALMRMVGKSIYYVIGDSHTLSTLVLQPHTD